MTIFLRSSCLTAMLLAVCGGCADQSRSPDFGNQRRISQTLNVVCTTNLVKDLVRQIGGDRLNVTAIMDGPGIDPHTYTPSPQDTNALTRADIVVYSGLHLEGQFDAALDSLGHRGIPVIALTDGLKAEKPSRLIQSGEGIADPHVWFDPDLWASCGQHLAAQLANIDAPHAAAYAANADKFVDSMERIKMEGLELAGVIPDDRRILVTAHDAFEYFARAFDFKVEAVQGISTDSEPGLRRINELIELLVDRHVSAVFTEQSVSDKNITALVAGCQSRGHALKIGARLYSDTAGAAGTPEATLAGALRYNIRKISDALSPQSATNATEESVEASP